MGDVRILPEESTRLSGRDAQKENIHAAMLVAEAVRTTLGPRGMDKMLVDPHGEITVTNDGITILEQMRLDHPCARMVAEVARTQEASIGDGTTTAVVIAGALLGRAEALIEQGTHPTVIVRGYKDFARKAEELLGRMAKSTTHADTDTLRKVALTAMTGKGVDRDALADLVLAAVHEGMERTTVRVEPVLGGRIEESILVKGIVLDKTAVVPGMPSRVEGARIAFLDVPLEVRNTEIDARITISAPEHLQGFLDMEERMLKGMVEKIAASGATLVVSQRGIDDLAGHELAKRGILAIRRVKQADLHTLARLSRGRIVSDLADLSDETLGTASLVEEQEFARDIHDPTRVLVVTGLPDTRGSTIIVRGSTPHVLAEAKRALEDSIGDVAAAISSGKVVGGAGAPEMELAVALDPQDAIGRAFTSALEIIPATLAENAGGDPAHVLAALREQHASGKTWAGVGLTGSTLDAWEAGVLEPLAVKTRALASAVEVATMLLRIDDVIAAKPAKEDPRYSPY